MALKESVSGLIEFKLQLDKAWFKLKDDPCLDNLDNLNFITQVFASKVSYTVTDEVIEQNEKATKTS
jgi:hypothetical protein